MTESPISRVEWPEWMAVLAGCAAASIAALAWSWQHGAMLNYGDAVAHLHIARRVFDSHQPRLSQLGSVWLPLPHVLLIPFVQIYAWWANGFAGVIPSALAYLAACAGVYRLARNWLRPAAAALALAFFATNPNLLYLQTTAMTEPLFVCEMIWVAVWLVEWQAGLDRSNPDRNISDPESRKRDLRRAGRLLWLIAAALVAAIFTRYDGWVMALFAWVCVGLVMARRGRLRSRSFWLASALIVAAPAAWFIYNASAFGDWLYFLRGPYSAKAIEIRTSVPGFPPHPGWHNPWVGLIFFLKAAELDAAASAWGNLLLALSLFGTLCAWLMARRRAFLWALLLWLPVPFYAYSVAYGSVPIFLPLWWPHSWYNTRYGMELLPALALGLGFAAQFAIAAVREFKPRWPNYAAGVLFALVALNAVQMARERPLVYVEGTKNLQAHRPYQVQIPPVLRALLAERPGSEILMITSVDPEIVALTGIPLRQTINECDLEIYRAALAAPAAHAAIVLAFDGDEVDRAVRVHPAGLTALRRFTAPGQPSGTLYVSGTLPAQQR
ncbi:MAG TPA: hypothetical protein VKG86_11880 [Terracidiphilus sp.]|nr:hypothetical protein [Terracidiphilus sp.]